MKAAIDTSVYVSYLLSPRGSNAWLLALWYEKRFEAIISPELFAELVDVLARPELVNRVDPQRKLALYRRLRYDAIWTAGAIKTSDKLPDPGDKLLLGAAIESRAGLIVTWDKRLLDVKNCQGIQIVSPEVFVSIIVRSKPAT